MVQDSDSRDNGKMQVGCGAGGLGGVGGAAIVNGGEAEAALAAHQAGDGEDQLAGRDCVALAHRGAGRAGVAGQGAQAGGGQAEEGDGGEAVFRVWVDEAKVVGGEGEAGALPHPHDGGQDLGRVEDAPGCALIAAGAGVGAALAQDKGVGGNGANPVIALWLEGDGDGRVAPAPAAAGGIADGHWTAAVGRDGMGARALGHAGGVAVGNGATRDQPVAGFSDAHIHCGLGVTVVLEMDILDPGVPVAVHIGGVATLGRVAGWGDFRAVGDGLEIHQGPVADGATWSDADGQGDGGGCTPVIDQLVSHAGGVAGPGIVMGKPQMAGLEVADADVVAGRQAVIGGGGGAAGVGEGAVTGGWQGPENDAQDAVGRLADVLLTDAKVQGSQSGAVGVAEGGQAQGSQHQAGVGLIDVDVEVGLAAGGEGGVSGGAGVGGGVAEAGAAAGAAAGRGEGEAG